MTQADTARLDAEFEPAPSTYSVDLSILPPTNDVYTKQMYWDDRYSKEKTDTHFDWCLRPDVMLPIM